MTAEPPDVREFESLVESGLSRLSDAESAQLSLGSRFDLAYNAAHALCLAALRWHGYRSQNRYVVFQVLPHTLGLGPEVWRVLSKAHDLRNAVEYVGKFDVDDKIVQGLLHAARAVAAKLKTLPEPTED